MNLHDQCDMVVDVLTCQQYCNKVGLHAQCRSLEIPKLNCFCKSSTSKSDNVLARHSKSSVYMFIAGMAISVIVRACGAGFVLLAFLGSGVCFSWKVVLNPDTPVQSPDAV